MGVMHFCQWTAYLAERDGGECREKERLGDSEKKRGSRDDHLRLGRGGLTGGGESERAYPKEKSSAAAAEGYEAHLLYGVSQEGA